MLNEASFPRLAFKSPSGISSPSYSFEVNYKDYLMNIVSLQAGQIQAYLEAEGFKVSGKFLKFRRIQTMVRKSDSGYTVVIRYKLVDDNVSVLGEFMISSASELVSPFVAGGIASIEQGIQEVTYGMLQAFRESVVRDLNLLHLNQVLKQLKPKSSPYLVQFALEDKSLKAVSELSDTKITWTVNQDFLVKMTDLYFYELLTNNATALSDVFYSYISVVDYLFHSDRTLFEGFLVSEYSVGFTLSLTGILKQFAIPLVTDKKQKSPLVYDVKDGVVSVYQLSFGDKHGRKFERFYVETLKAHNTTWEVHKIDAPTVYRVTDNGLVLQ